MRLVLTIVSLLIAGSVYADVGGATVGGSYTSKEPKIRLWVDKVLQASNGNVMTEAFVTEIAGNGFNVIVPRHGFDTESEVDDMITWTATAGVEYMTWMRGTLPGCMTDDNCLVLDARFGTEVAIYSPNAPEFWDYLEDNIADVFALKAASNSNLRGVFLDFENYSGGGGLVYPYSYDEETWAAWIGAGSPPTIESWQAANWATNAVALRAAIDAHDPTFQIFVYPFLYDLGTNPVFDQIFYEEMDTAAAPMVHGFSRTYGRAAGSLTHAQAITSNDGLASDDFAAKSVISNVSGRAIGGVDPITFGADPEFSGKNALMLAWKLDGYWVFPDAVEYQSQSYDEYMTWFKWANDRIVLGDFEDHTEARVDNVGGFMSVWDANGAVASSTAPAQPGGTVTMPGTRFRKDNFFILGGSSGKQMEIKITHVKINAADFLLQYDLREEDSITRRADGTVAYDTQGTINYTPGATDEMLIGIGAWLDSFTIDTTNTPIATIPYFKTQIFDTTSKWYFNDGDGDTITIRGGSTTECIKAEIDDHLDVLQETLETDADTTTDVSATIDTSGNIWSIEFMASTGEGCRVEDYNFTAPFTMSNDPNMVFTTP